MHSLFQEIPDYRYRYNEVHKGCTSDHNYKEKSRDLIKKM